MLSIVIPIYNVENYLAACLDSILNQSNSENLEVFLVDDGSTDNSSKIAKKYADQYPHIFHYLHKQNGGLSDARNFAIPFINNEYLFFIDSDDFIDLSAIAKIRQTIERYHPDLLVFDYYNTWNDHKESISISSHKEGFINKKDYLLMNPAAWNKVIKTSIFKENAIQFPKGLWYEDRATTAIYANVCKKIYYINEPLYYYRQRDNSIMKQKSYDSRMLDIVTAMKQVDEQLSDGEFHDEKEFLFISNLIFQNALRLLPLHRIIELKECIQLVQLKYPNWKKNIYFKKQSTAYKIFCYLLGMRFYFLAACIVKMRLKE